MTFEGALIAKLAADATLASLAPGGVWLEPAPESARGAVFVVIGLQSSEDVDGLGGARLIEDGEWLVKAIGSGGEAATVAAAAARIDALLHHGSITLEGSATVMGIGRRERVRYVEDDGNQRYQHAGGVYAVMVSA